MNHAELTILQVTIALASVSSAISGCEYLVNWRMFRDDGLFAWRLHRLRNHLFVRIGLNPIYDRIFSFPGVLFFLSLQILFSMSAFIVAISSASRPLLATITTVLGVVMIILSIRGADGRNGADHMSMMTFIASGLGLISASVWVWRVVILFIAAQLVIAYSTSGWLRSQERGWWDGSLLLKVLRQEGYGNLTAWRFSKRFPFFAAFISSAVLIFECSSLPALLLPRNLLIIYITFGIGFHFANAAIIGLNTFFWAFIAGYPAFYYASVLLHQII